MFNYNKFRELRRKYNLNQFDVANKLNISPSAIGMYEQGRRQPDNEMIKKIANLLENVVYQHTQFTLRHPNIKIN